MFTLERNVLIMFFMFVATLKALNVSNNDNDNDADWLTITMMFVEYFIAIILLGKYRRVSAIMSIFAFASFFVWSISSIAGVVEAGSCGCFGAFETGPWPKLFIAVGGLWMSIKYAKSLSIKT